MIQRDVGAVTSYAEAVAGGYTGTRAQWRQLLATLPNEPYIATYGETQYADVSAALANGKIVLVRADGGFWPLTRKGTNDRYEFNGIANSAYVTYVLSTMSVWQKYTTVLVFQGGGKIQNTTIDAMNVNYHHYNSRLTADNVEQAIDEVIFLAHYGTTTLAEVEEAIAAGSTLFAIDGDDIVLPYVGDIGAGPMFAGVTLGIARTWTLSDVSETWSHTEYTIPDTAAELPYVNSASSLDAVNVQEAIDELDAKVSGLDARSMEYDNTTSGLQSGNVQSAIDELAGMIGDVEMLLEAL